MSFKWSSRRMDGPDRVLGTMDSAETMGRFPFALADLDGVEWTLDNGVGLVQRLASGVVGCSTSGSVTSVAVGIFSDSSMTSSCDEDMLIAVSDMIGGRYRVKQFAQ